MTNLKGKLYRFIMRTAHKYNWHYAPPIYPDGNTQLWCKWCGFRQTIKRKGEQGLKELNPNPCQVKEVFPPYKPLSDNCSLCSNPKPFSFIPVDDVRNPHCIKCGKPLLLEPLTKDKEIQNER